MLTPRFDATVLDATALLTLALAGHDVPNRPGMPFWPSLSRPLATRAARSSVQAVIPTRTAAVSPERKDLVGVWLSADGAVRLDLRSEGTYERSVVGRRRSSRGHYVVDGCCVLLQDDNGLRTVVTVTDDELEMAGHPLWKAEA